MGHPNAYRGPMRAVNVTVSANHGVQSFQTHCKSKTHKSAGKSRTSDKTLKPDQAKHRKLGIANLFRDEHCLATA
jgi:hypothetical protein